MKIKMTVTKQEESGNGVSIVAEKWRGAFSLQPEQKLKFQTSKNAAKFYPIGRELELTIKPISRRQ